MEKIAYKEDEEIELADTPAKTKEQIYEEADRTAYVLSSLGMLGQIFGHDFLKLTRELVHWAYDPTGKHASPSEMVLMLVEEAQSD